MQLVARAVLGIALSTAATASAEPGCPAAAVDATAASLCAAAAGVRDAQVSLDEVEAALAAAQARLAARAGIAYPEPPAVVIPAVPVAAASPPGPRAGSLTLEVALPNDFTFVPHGTLIGIGGAEFGLGYRLTRSFELGWTADVEELLTTDPDAAGEYLRIRSGVQTRYRFGASSPRPGARVLFTPWLGARAGFELLDDGETTTRGEYADVSLGVDWWLHRHQVGMYVSLGMSVEPATAYQSVTVTETALATLPTSAPAVPVPTVASPYVAIGWRWGFW